MIKKLPPVEYLRECFRYEKATGKLFWKRRPLRHFKHRKAWKVWNARQPRTEALASIKKGTQHRHGSIDKIIYLQHRVIWKLLYKVEPPPIIDHRNRKGSVNLPKNLRAASHSQNFINRTSTIGKSGIIGVRKSRFGWEARIHKDKKYIHLGTFPTKESAVDARKQAEKIYYGEFAP
jgi:hypothetical protein